RAKHPLSLETNNLFFFYSTSRHFLPQKEKAHSCKMATALAARQAANILRLSSSRSASQAASFIPRRGLAGAAGNHHGPPKVEFLKDPISPSKWKEDLFVIVSLTGCGLAIFGGYKAFSGSKKKDEVNQLRLDEIIHLDKIIHMNKTMKRIYCSKIESGPAGTTIEFKERSRELLAEEVGPVIPPVVQVSE
ncbi:hypothetical protein M8C21_006885, partial [Ambrosia artemisiifolia]